MKNTPRRVWPEPASFSRGRYGRDQRSSPYRRRLNDEEHAAPRLAWAGIV
jgi:hypothetical protein